MPTATVTSKGQITIPKEIREQLNLKTGDKVDFVPSNDGKWYIQPATQPVEKLFGFLKKPSNVAPLSVEDMDEAVTEAVIESLGIEVPGSQAT